jgi:hypothetical protein
VLARWGQGVGVLIPSPLHQAEQFTPGPSNRVGGREGGGTSPPFCGGKGGGHSLPCCSAILSVFVLSTGLTDTRYNVEFSNRAEGELTPPPLPSSPPRLCLQPPPATTMALSLRQPNCQLSARVFGRSRKFRRLSIFC